MLFRQCHPVHERLHHGDICTNQLLRREHADIYRVQTCLRSPGRGFAHLQRRLEHTINSDGLLSLD
jgi:hypothetical protein